MPPTKEKEYANNDKGHNSNSNVESRGTLLDSSTWNRPQRCF